MVIKRLKNILTAILLVLMGLSVSAQESVRLLISSLPSDYTIDSITISGIKFLDVNALIGISGLRTGKEISVPGEAITQATQKLGSRGVFRHKDNDY